MSRKDPVGPEFYVPLAIAEKSSDVVFYISATLSIVLPLMGRAEHPTLYGIVQSAFIVAVVMTFVLGAVIKLYFSSRAQISRTADFVSNAFSVPLISNPSESYYNPPQGDPILRVGSSVLENALFTKSILRSMLVFERGQVIIYAALWLWAVSFRASDLDLLAVAAQVLFGEQIVSRWARMEWLRARVERIFDDVYALFRSTSNTSGPEFRARVLEALVRYEAGKAQAGISLSSVAFRRLNPRLTPEWERISQQLGLGPPTVAP